MHSSAFSLPCWLTLIAAMLMPFLTCPAATLTDAQITEFLASNADGIVDEDGDSSDWIEIHNASGVAGDLGGWYLTDDPQNLTKWALPAVPLSADERIVVFASGKNRSDPATELHANFRISASPGGYLALVKPDATTTTTVFASYPNQYRDISYSTGGYFAEPTPGAENASPYDGLVGDTRFSVDRGFYDTAFDLEITTSTENAEIRYTTDGSPPSETTGLIYTGPVAVTGTTVVRAMAHKPGFRSTNIDTHTYIFPEDIYGPQLVDSLKAVPTISLVTQANYDLRLMSVASTSDLPSPTSQAPDQNLVVVALVDGGLHIRIIDVHIRRNRETNTTERVIVNNKAEAALAAGPQLTDLRNLLTQTPFPEASSLSPESRREIIDKAFSVSAFSPATPFLDDTNNEYIEHKSSIEMIFPDGTDGFQEEGGMSNFGGGFTNFPKKSFRVYFRSKYGTPKLRFPLFAGFDYPNFPPAEEFDAIDLRSGSHDMAQRGGYMAARFVDDSMLEMGQIAPHGRFVHLYLNGRYWGQYHLRERWNADMAASYFGGSKDDYDAISANNDRQSFQPGTAYDGTNEFWNEGRVLLRRADPFTNAADHIDIANVVDFMLLFVSGGCESEFRAFGSRTRGVPFKFILRDPDGYLPGGNWNRSYAVTHDGPNNVMTELRTGGNPDYDIFLADRIHKHFFNDGALTAGKSVERLRRRFLEARTGFAAEAERWNFRTVSSWESYVNGWLDTGLDRRERTMIRSFERAGMYPTITAPVFSQHGGSIAPGTGVTMTSNVTTIYYTLDGSDPRLSGGTINPEAFSAPFSNDPPAPQEFITEPVVLAGHALLRARAYDTAAGTWSALNEAFFSIGSIPADSTNLLISEVLYHPAEPSTPEEIAVSTDRDDFEFVEFLNTGITPIDLTGVRFTDGINFEFPENTLLDPGDRLLIVRDIEAFTARYGSTPGLVIAGEYSGRLSNDGERIALFSDTSGDLLSFTYNDQPPWPSLSDGGGFSMVLGDPSNSPDITSPAAWAPHSTVGGAPGAPDSVQQSPYLLWKNANSILNDGGDGDRDNIPNFAEYCLGGDPDRADPEILPVPLVVTDGGQTYPGIAFQRNLLATDVIYKIETSDTLANWSSDEGVVVSDTPDPGGETSTLTLRSTTPMTPEASLHVRLSMSIP